MADPTVAVMWPRLGPYHVARLRAADALFRERGGRTVAIETARTEAVYAWDVVEGAEGFERVTLFAEAEYSALAPGAIRRAVQAKLDDLGPDAVAINGWTIPDAHAAMAWCRRHGRPAIVMSDSKFDDLPHRPWYKEAVKCRIIALCDAALVAGRPHRDYILGLGMDPDRVFDGCDVVDNEYFARAASAARAAAGLDRESLGIGTAPFFLASNRFIPRKNLARLSSAYGRYRAETGADAWDLVLLGDGEERAALEKQVRDGRTDGVRFPGFRQVREIPTYYALAACFIHPALQDQWGLVVNEAMACGLPVLVSRTAGCRYDLVHEGGNGWTFDPASADEMAAALTRMHRLSPGGRAGMGRRSRRIIADWGPERFAEHLWQAVAAGRRHAARRRRGLAVLDRMILRV